MKRFFVELFWDHAKLSLELENISTSTFFLLCFPVYFIPSVFPVPCRVIIWTNHLPVQSLTSVCSERDATSWLWFCDGCDIVAFSSASTTNNLSLSQERGPVLFFSIKIAILFAAAPFFNKCNFLSPPPPMNIVFKVFSFKSQQSKQS